MLSKLGFQQVSVFALSLFMGFALTSGVWLRSNASADLQKTTEITFPQDQFLQSPQSSIGVDRETGLSIDFCAEWNPDFKLIAPQCCSKKAPITYVKTKKKKRRARGRSCLQPPPERSSYCSYRTSEQLDYEQEVKLGKLDVLSAIENSSVSGRQSYCAKGDGFLAWGKPVIGTELNRLVVKNPNRCLNFGTNQLVGVLEYVGRQVRSKYPAPQYTGVQIMLGDLSTPRGGCVTGMSGRRAHASHTSGRDVDLTFLVAKSGRSSPEKFHASFDPEVNWWFLKQVFQNPVSCVKTVFLDKKWIGKLAKVARGDSFWGEVRPFIQHVKGHKNHFHIRVGQAPGKPGCIGGADSDDELVPELENPESGDDLDANELEGQDAEEKADLSLDPVGLEKEKSVLDDSEQPEGTSEPTKDGKLEGVNGAKNESKKSSEASGLTKFYRWFVPSVNGAQPSFTGRVPASVKRKKEEKKELEAFIKSRG